MLDPNPDPDPDPDPHPDPNPFPEPSCIPVSDPLRQKVAVPASVADPDPQDPYVFGPPGSGSTSTTNGSGSGPFNNPAPIVL